MFNVYWYAWRASGEPNRVPRVRDASLKLCTLNGEIFCALQINWYSGADSAEDVTEGDDADFDRV